MFEEITEADRLALDKILKARRSVRSFSPIPPDRREVEEIIRAGLIAPYASIPAKGKPDFRKLFVVSTKSQSMGEVTSFLRQTSGSFLLEMRDHAGTDSPKDESARSLTVSHLFGNAPYLVIAAERKGFPPTYMADQSISLSYCMYNMWLKAVSLRIGFRLLSIFVHLKLGSDKAFCEFLGIPVGEYAVDACVLGYPAETYKASRVAYPAFESSVRWMDE